jgi:hypothetical protein
MVLLNDITFLTPPFSTNESQYVIHLGYQPKADIKPLPDSFLAMHNISKEEETQELNRINSICHERRKNLVNPFTGIKES